MPSVAERCSGRLLQIQDAARWRVGWCDLREVCGAAVLGLLEVRVSSGWQFGRPRALATLKRPWDRLPAPRSTTVASVAPCSLGLGLEQFSLRTVMT